MLIDNVGLHSYDLSRSIPLAFRDPNSLLAYQLMGIEGLGADQIVTRYSGQPGFYVPTLSSRIVVVNLGLNPYNEATSILTYSSLRDEVYKIIGAIGSSSVYLYFNYGDDTVAVISGYITKVEPAIFDKKPTMQLTIDCSKYPMLRAPGSTSIDVDAIFYDPTHMTISDEESTAPHGFKFSVFLTADSESFRLSSGDRGWHFHADFAFQSGDRYYISSEPNEKEVYVIRDDATIHIADKISNDSFWPLLEPGDNHLSITADGSFDMDSITYHATYWGI